MHLVWLPLEPLPDRWTSSWARWFPPVIQDKAEADSFTWERIEPPRSYGPHRNRKVGNVFDAFDTNRCKAGQLQSLIHRWRGSSWDSKTVLLFAEAWYPGIEMVGYINAFLPEDKRVKVVGCLHGGAYDEYDFTNTAGMAWAPDFDEVVRRNFDALLVATLYHKNLCASVFNSMQVHVTGHPFFPKELQQKYPPATKREPLVLFPHRLDGSKGHEDFDTIIHIARQSGLAFTAEKTYETCQSNPGKYYDKLRVATAVVSCARQETFGTAMLEARALGAVPIVPDRLCYPEMYDEAYRYKTLEQAAEVICQALHGELPPLAIYPRTYGSAIDNMIDVCLELTS